jgi:SpoVK/Ycf46/Vps4 family AAA+-type ATPase
VSAALAEADSAVRGEREHWEANLRARFEGKRSAGKKTRHGRLLRVAELFGLGPFEVDLLAVLWTGAYAPQWRAELAAVDVLPGHVTVLGVARAFGHAPRVRLASESPLRLWHMVAEHPFVEGTAAVSLDAHISAWLDGEAELDRVLIGQVELLQPRFELASWQLDACAAELDAGLRRGDRWRVRLCGHDTVAAQACAAALARRLGLSVLQVQAGALAGEEGHERAVRVLRQAYLDRCAPCWHATDALRAASSEVVPFPLQFVIGSEGIASTHRQRDFVITLAEPDAEERRSLWRAALPGAASWPREALDDLAFRHEASCGEIMHAASRQPRDAHEAALHLRSAVLDDLGSLAQRVACEFVWDDLVVPAPVRARLEEIVFEGRERGRLWSEREAARLYPQGRGLVALFSGAPGTGKTMAAQVIAAELGLDLLRVDISHILSKWVGETAQHLQKVLSSAASRRAVLLFDEADALFGKRVEDARQAQDHFINMDISHLMIALESYTGIVVLATNLKANLDSAFVRRIRHAVDFPMPDATARTAIWTRAAQALFGAPLKPQLLEAVARVARIGASGAQIKNAALSAAFAARRLRSVPDATLLGEMLGRELAKDGAGMSARELASTLEASA